MEIGFRQEAYKLILMIEIATNCSRENYKRRFTNNCFIHKVKSTNTMKNVTLFNLKLC